MYVGGFHGVIVLTVYRSGNFIYYRVNIPIVRQLLLAVYYLIDYILVRMMLNSEFPAPCKIGKRLCLPHGGKGIIIDKNCIIGDDVTIFHQVTIGRSYRKGNDGSPVIGNNVFIGTGAKILGNVTIGNRAKIGANAVVMDDVPERATAVLPSTKIILRAQENESSVYFPTNL